MDFLVHYTMKKFEAIRGAFFDKNFVFPSVSEEFIESPYLKKYVNEFAKTAEENALNKELVELSIKESELEEKVDELYDKYLGDEEALEKLKIFSIRKRYIYK
jgi:hypothetical protein